MSMQTNIEALIEAARHLTPEDQEKLLHVLLHEPRPSKRQHRITELRGLGKDIWQDVDAQKYVDAERDSWDN
ncbi:MAG TPA: hypothetical protein VII34_00500 [Pyrinomonadaceae bacterium]|jgi:hypothetical protein